MGTYITDFESYSTAYLSLHIKGILMHARRIRFRVNEVQRASDLDKAAQRVAYRGLQPGWKWIRQLVCRVLLVIFGRIRISGRA